MRLRRRSPSGRRRSGRDGRAHRFAGRYGAAVPGYPLRKGSPDSHNRQRHRSDYRAMYIAAFEKQGVNIRNTRMFIQNDVLKEYFARGTYIFPPEAAVKLSSDVIEYCARNLPGWTPLAMSGYHIRDRGSTAT